MRHSVGRAPPSGSRDLRAGVPGRPRMAERRLPANEHVDGPRRGAGRVLGLRAHQLAAHAALPEGVACALPRRRTARDRRAHAGVLVRARPRHRRARRRAARDRVPGAARPRLRDLARVRQQGLAGALPVRPHRQVGAHPLRRGRVRGHRARHRGVRRPRAGADGARAPGGRARGSCSSPRPRTSRFRQTATGWSWCATGPTARTGSRRRTPAPRPASSTAPAAPTRRCPEPASSRGSTRWTERSRRSLRGSASTACSSRPCRQRLRHCARHGVLASTRDPRARPARAQRRLSRR